MRGRPFQRGHDPRRNTAPPPARSRTAVIAANIRRLAQSDRADTYERLKALRDQDEDRRVALEACKVLAAYSDGVPKEGVTPEEAEPAQPPEQMAEVLKLIQPPEGA